MSNVQRPKNKHETAPLLRTPYNDRIIEPDRSTEAQKPWRRPNINSVNIGREAVKMKKDKRTFRGKRGEVPRPNGFWTSQLPRPSRPPPSCSFLVTSLRHIAWITWIRCMKVPGWIDKPASTQWCNLAIDVSPLLAPSQPPEWKLGSGPSMMRCRS